MSMQMQQDIREMRRSEQRMLKGCKETKGKV